MPELKDRIKDGLDEARTLMLGAQVLLGFEYNAAFQPGFPRLGTECQLMKLVSLGLIAAAVALLMAPAAFHQIALHGRSRPQLPRFVSKATAAAMLPFALALGLDSYVAVQAVLGRGAIIAAILMAGLALWFWYGFGLLRRRVGEGSEGKMDRQDAEEKEGPAELRDCIEHALTEIRVVIPGAQALLGFQLVSIFTDGFEKLPRVSKEIHLISLALVALSAILLMTPAAYHRLAERGNYSKAMQRIAGRFLVLAMIPLALGIAGDFLVVTQKVTRSYPIAAVGAGVLLLLCFGLWFGFTWFKRVAAVEPTRVSSARQRAS